VQALKLKKTRIACRFQVSLAPKASRAAPRGIRDQRGLTLNKLKIALQLGWRAQLIWRDTTIQWAISGVAGGAQTNETIWGISLTEMGPSAEQPSVETDIAEPMASVERFALSSDFSFALSRD
jgi:hypothetical protein